MATPITIPTNAYLIPVNLSSSWKTFTLPVVSTNAGRTIIFKDMFGNAVNSTIRLSTIGLDRIERTNVSSMVLSNAYGAWTFANDGITNWFLLDAYLNNLRTIGPAASGLSVPPAVRYSFLSANYSGSGPVSNVGSNSGVGAATVVSASYTSASPSFISIGNYTGHYVLSPSLTNTQTLVMIAKIKSGNSGYMLDARTALGNGWIYTTGGSIGPDWTSAGIYYKDTVLTSITLAGSDQSTDNQWHHFVYQRAAWSGAVTFLARFSLNESAFSDCAEIMVFTQALTAQQVKDNFNFFAPRFGWSPVA
jgi:hypothetical protein